MQLYRWGFSVGNLDSYIQVCFHQMFVQFKLFGVYKLYHLRFQSPVVVDFE